MNQQVLQRFGAYFDSEVDCQFSEWLGNVADIRRTGYPKLFPIVNNLNTDGVTVQRGMRRLPFPQSEYNTNNANVKAAVSMLGGADNSATDLWWAKKN